MHAYISMTPGSMTLVAAVSGGSLRVTVTDEGRGMAPRTDSPGLGLGLGGDAAALRCSRSQPRRPGHRGQPQVPALAAVAVLTEHELLGQRDARRRRGVGNDGDRLGDRAGERNSLPSGVDGDSSSPEATTVPSRPGLDTRGP